MSRSSLPSRVFRGLILIFVTIAAAHARAEGFRAGVGRADITPTEPVRLGGYAQRVKPCSNVVDHIFVKALALDDGTGAITLFVSADTIGAPRPFNDALAERIEKELKIERSRFVFANSHCHSTPILYGRFTDANGSSPEEFEATKRYTDFFRDQAFAAAQQAVRELAPVRLHFGRGQAFFTVNRRQFKPEGLKIGIDPDGIVDRDVPVLRVLRDDRSLMAIVFGYACHNVTPGPSDEISGDWAGYAQEDLEHTFPGSTALFITGCGADANPQPNGRLAVARAHGLQLAGAVARVLTEPMTPVTGPVTAAYQRIDLPLEKTPDRSYYEEKLKDKAPHVQRYAQRILAQLDRGEPLETTHSDPIQVLRFGDAFTFIGLGGEDVAEYALRLKRELPAEHLWTAGYCNDIFAYVPTRRILVEGGYEADTSIMNYGLPIRFAPGVEDMVVKEVLELVGKTGGTVPGVKKK